MPLPIPLSYRTNRPEGYSLIELLVSVAVGGIVLVGVVTFFSRFNQSANTLSNKRDATTVVDTLLRRFHWDFYTKKQGVLYDDTYRCVQPATVDDSDAYCLTACTSAGVSCRSVNILQGDWKLSPPDAKEVSYQSGCFDAPTELAGFVFSDSRCGLKCGKGKVPMVVEERLINGVPGRRTVWPSEAGAKDKGRQASAAELCVDRNAAAESVVVRFGVWTIENDLPVYHGRDFEFPEQALQPGVEVVR